MTIVRILTYFIIGTIPILFASVQPWVWSFYAFCIIAGFIIFLWYRRVNSNAYTSDTGIKWAVGSFFTASLFLCLPLPPLVLSFLSPVRFKEISNAWNLTDNHPAWESISYASRSALTWWVFLLSLLLFFIVLRYLFKNKKNPKDCRLHHNRCWFTSVGIWIDSSTNTFIGSALGRLYRGLYGYCPWHIY